MIGGDISELARESLANLPLRKARGRLRNDGAESGEATRRRLKWIAIERGIPDEAIAEVMKGRLRLGPLAVFCKKHNVSLDWLMCGDLKGLQKMTKEASAEAAEIPAAELQELQRLYLALKPQAFAESSSANCPVSSVALSLGTEGCCAGAGAGAAVVVGAAPPGRQRRPST